MKKEQLFDAVGGIDDDILAHHRQMDLRFSRKHAQKRQMVRVLAVAACLMLVIVLSLPLAALSHPAGKAIVQGDSAALTEYLLSVDGFAAWQDQTAEKLEQTLPRGMWELLQTTPIMDVLTQSQYPDYAWKGTIFSQYVQQPEVQMYYLNDPGGTVPVQSVVNVGTTQYQDQSVPVRFILTQENVEYTMEYVYSETQSFVRQAVHVYAQYTEKGVNLAYLDAQTGECIYWYTCDRAEPALPDAVAQQDLIERAYEMLSTKVRDPEAYVLKDSVSDQNGTTYICEYTRQIGTSSLLQDVTLSSCDRAVFIYDAGGNLVSYDFCYLGALRNADKEIPQNLIAYSLDYAQNSLFDHDGTEMDQDLCVVITPDGRLACTMGGDQRLENGELAEFRCLTYLTEPDPDLVNSAYEVEQVQSGQRVLLSSVGQSGATVKYQYDQYGRLICKMQQAATGKSTEERYTYDEQGRVIEEIISYDDRIKPGGSHVPTHGSRMCYTYNEQGHLIQEDCFDLEGNLLSTSRHEYDALGRVVLTRSGDRYSTYTYGEDNSYVILSYRAETDIENKTEVKCDDKGNAVSKKHYTNGEFTSEDAYEYDEKGRLIRNNRYENGEWKTAFEYVYLEDHPTVKLKIEYTFGKLFCIDATHYNQFGEIVYYHYEDVRISGAYVYEYGHPTP